MQQLLESIGGIVERHAQKPRYETSIPGLTLYRLQETIQKAHAFYNPRICIVLRGAKTVSIGDAPFRMDPANFLLVTVDLPVASGVMVAADGSSHLALTIDLDRPLLAEVLQRMPVADMPAGPPPGVIAAPLTPTLLQPVARYLDLLDHGTDADFMRPLILQEIYYRLAGGNLGPVLAQFALAGSHLSQIGRATNWIKAHYQEAMSIEALADLAGMSVTSFHRHFKAVTLMTPIQYRTQIRLQEARRMLLAGQLAAGAAGIAVGYDSQSQFTRDYKRLFGAPPLQGRRAAAAAAAQLGGAQAASELA